MGEMDFHLSRSPLLEKNRHVLVKPQIGPKGLINFADWTEYRLQITIYRAYGRRVPGG